MWTSANKSFQVYVKEFVVVVKFNGIFKFIISIKFNVIENAVSYAIGLNAIDNSIVFTLEDILLN